MSALVTYYKRRRKNNGRRRKIAVRIHAGHPVPL
jgi:hypothetical protein